MTQNGSYKSQRSDLTKRWVMALIMIPIGLLLVWLGGWYLAAACAIGAGIMGAEWSRMAGYPYPWVVVLAAGIPVIVFGTAGARASVFALWAVSVAVAVIGERANKNFLQTLMGVLYIGAIPLALFVLREGEWNGRAAALMLMGMVWASDSGAFFTGRHFGGPLLSPKDSPNKTWSGAIGAIIATSLCGPIAAYIVDVPAFRWIVFAGLLSIVCQYGDLIESRIKRFFGTKDASGLLPGHGGLMDRVDGLGAVCVVSVVLFTVFPDLPVFMGLEA